MTSWGGGGAEVTREANATLAVNGQLTLPSVYIVSVLNTEDVTVCVLKVEMK